jgi:hypothetical protein
MVTARFAASTGLILRLLGLAFQSHSRLVLIMAQSRMAKRLFADGKRRPWIRNLRRASGR